MRDYANELRTLNKLLQSLDNESKTKSKNAGACWYVAAAGIISVEGVWDKIKNAGSVRKRNLTFLFRWQESCCSNSSRAVTLREPEKIGLQFAAKKEAIKRCCSIVSVIHTGTAISIHERHKQYTFRLLQRKEISYSKNICILKKR